MSTQTVEERIERVLLDHPLETLTNGGCMCGGFITVNYDARWSELRQHVVSEIVKAVNEK